MKIAIDLDDVVLDFVGGLRTVLKNEYAVELTDEQIFQWNLHPILDPIVGRNWWSWLKDRDWLWSTFPAIDGAIGGIDKLRRQGHYLVCVTSKPEWAEHNVWKWLGKWRPSFQQVIITKEGETKAHATDADVLVDDKLENVVEFAKTGRFAILFDSPHNRKESLPPGVVRAVDWMQVLELIESWQSV